MAENNWVVLAHMTVTTVSATECDPSYPSDDSFPPHILFKKIHKQNTHNFVHDYVTSMGCFTAGWQMVTSYQPMLQ
jgi:hypothetical protein